MDAPLKKILRALSLELRHTLEGSHSEDGTWNAGDLERRLNQIGIWRDRAVKPVGEMPNLSPVDRRARELIDAYLSLRSDAGVPQSDAVAEFIRESAYSWANRLFALRCMEARGIIDPVILQEEIYPGNRSMVHDRFARRYPTQCTGDDDGFFAMLSEEFQERFQELPELFAPDSPAVALRPSVVALKHCIALLSGSIPANGGRTTDKVFSAPDAFGWAYQYWNAEEKDRVFDMVRTKKGAKIEGSDIIPATQLYTEPYMVKFLVQNSLGAMWMTMHPESKLSAAWEYYVKDADRTPNEKKLVAEITFLDPACGSGHFLIEAFDLLHAMYEEEGQLKEPAAICQSILNNNLFGIDIDERAVQITKAVLWMKAAETVFAKTKKQLTGDGLSEFHDHIIATNIRLPNGKDHLDAFLKKHPEDAPLRPALLTVFEGLQNVHELGSLVQIEEPVDKELKVLKERAKQQKFDPDAGGEMVERIDFPRWKKQVMKRLKAHFRDEAEKALPTEAFFSQSAVKGLALFNLLARRYDVVAANPPYMGSKNMGSQLKKDIFVNYPEGKRDLYSAFIIKCLDLSSNFIGLMTLHTFITSKSFADLRKKILNSSQIRVFAHLGTKTMKSLSNPNAQGFCLYILNKNLTNPPQSGIYFRLVDLDEKDRPLKQLIKSTNSPRLFVKTQDLFRQLPSNQILYWISESLIQHLIKDKKIKDFANVPKGLSTADNNRFLRFFWEVPLNNKWIPYAKGGGYKKWYGLNWYSIRWDWDGFLIKNLLDYSGKIKSCVRNEKYYSSEGFTYTEVANSSLGVRLLEKNELFDARSPGIISLKERDLSLLAVLNSRISTFLFRCISPGIMLDQAYAPFLPIPDNLPNEELCILSKSAIVIKKTIVEQEMTERSFEISSRQNISKKRTHIQDLLLLLIESRIEKLTFNFHKVSNYDQAIIVAETGIPSGWHPLIIGYDILPDFSREFPIIRHDNIKNVSECNRKKLSADEIELLKNQLHSSYEKGYGSKNEPDNIDIINPDEEDENLEVGACIPIPSETFLEELSQKMEIHPISIYWLLKEGIEKEGWRCIPEEKHYLEDLFTVMVLRLLGHRWPKQIDAGEPVPEGADPDGIIPITSGLVHPTLLQHVRDRIVAEFPNGKIHEIEKEFGEIVGMSLERWLAGEFFKHHISQFKKRPIAWQLSSSPLGNGSGKGKGRGSRREPAFSCLVYYHKIDADILHKIRTQYVGDLINRYGTELRALEWRKEQLTGDQASRKVQLDNWIAELKDFGQMLQDVADVGFDSTTLRETGKKEPLDKWTSRDGKSPQPKTGDEFYAQEKRYDPDINDGVRVNIAPLQKAGLLAADVIAKKDIDKAIADRAEWRTDERRWCREGKLPKCGWWG